MKCFGGCAKAQGSPGSKDSLAAPLNPQSQEHHETRPSFPKAEPPPKAKAAEGPTKILRPVKTVSAQFRAKEKREAQSTRHMENVWKTDMFRWGVLIMTAVLSSALSFGVDQFTFTFGVWRSALTTADNVVMVTAINVAAVLLARLINRTTLESEGSGFPEMKAMLFGKVMLNFLTLRALTCKALSLSLGVGAGLPLGKEGPNVHMAACISRSLAPEFYEPAKAGDTNNHMKNTKVTYLLLAACSVAVGASFAAPIGGVIFALELMLPQVFDTVAYWGCFVSSVAGSLLYTLLRVASSGSLILLPLMSTNLHPHEGATSARPVTRLLVDLLLGCICGVMGGLWVQTHAKVNKYMKKFRAAGISSQAADQQELLSPKRGARSLFANQFATPMKMAWSNKCFQWRDLFQVTVVVVLNTVISANLPLLHGKPQPLLLSTLFDKTINLPERQADWALDWLGPVMTMFCCYLFKAGITILSLCLPISAGMVAPVMIIGGLLGRTYGMLLPIPLLNFLLSTPGNEAAVTDDDRAALIARLAIVGAAAHATAVSRAFAMAITVYEVLTLPESILPLCVSCLAAIFVANKVSLPFFDMNLTGRGLGGITALSQTDHANKSATCIMRAIDSDADALHAVVSVQEIRDLLSKSDNVQQFPIVQNLSSSRVSDGVVPTLKGCISRKFLVELIQGETKPNKDFNLLAPELTLCVNGHRAPVCLNPQTVTPDAFVRDVYIVMKASEAEAVFVIEDNALIGIIEWRELLGHDKDKDWFG